MKKIIVFIAIGFFILFILFGPPYEIEWFGAKFTSAPPVTPSPTPPLLLLIPQKSEKLR
jgi:hypothetical protein